MRSSVQPPRLALAALAAIGAFLATAEVADGQIYTWNNTGTNFSSAGSWNPAGGPPGSGDIVQFTPGGSPFPTTLTQPTIDADRTTSTIILAPTPHLNGWTFSGSNTLTV